MIRPALLLLTLAASAPALAQQSERAADRVRYKAITEIDIESVDVKAEAGGPGSSLITEPRRPRFSSTIRLRADFNEEMTESLAELR